MGERNYTMAENNIRIDRELKNPKLRALLATRMDLGTATAQDHKKIQANLEEIVREVVENASFLVPAEVSCEITKEKDGGLSIPAGTDISFVVFSDGKNSFIPVFSEIDEYKRWEAKADNVHAMTIDFVHLVNLLERSGGTEGLVLNPFSDNMMMSREIIVDWCNHFQLSKNGNVSNAISIDKAKDVYNLAPAPFQLMNTLCEAARNTPAINAMWLRGINLNGEDSYLLIVDFEGNRNTTFAALGEASRKFLGEKPLHIVPRDDGFGGKATEGANPIYTK